MIELMDLGRLVIVPLCTLPRPEPIAVSDSGEYPALEPLLRTFWRKVEAAKQPHQRLDLLQRWAHVRFRPALVCPREPHAEFRGEWLRRQLWCWVCYARWTHLHHIVPVSRGGRNRAENYVPLCYGCHLRVHG